MALVLAGVAAGNSVGSASTSESFSEGLTLDEVILQEKAREVITKISWLDHYFALLNKHQKELKSMGGLVGFMKNGSFKEIVFEPSLGVKPTATRNIADIAQRKMFISSSLQNAASCARQIEQNEKIYQTAVELLSFKGQGKIVDDLKMVADDLKIVDDLLKNPEKLRRMINQAKELGPHSNKIVLSPESCCTIL